MPAANEASVQCRSHCAVHNPARARHNEAVSKLIYFNSMRD